MVSLSVAFSVTTALYVFALNPMQTTNYAWMTRKVFSNSTDCGGDIEIYCVSTFTFGGGVSFAAIIPDHVSMRSVIITPSTKSGCSIFLSYNYTGPDWTIQVGSQ